MTLANDNAVTNSVAAANTALLRRDPSTCGVTATAASAPTDPASPANTPKWCVHLVGVNIIARNEMMVIPMMRRLGPAAVPVMWPRRSIIATDTASATIRASTAKRRAIEPSGVAIISRSYQVCSSNQLRLGPTARLSAVAWATAAKVWSRNIRMIGTVAAAAIRPAAAAARTAGAAADDRAKRPDRHQQRADRGDTGRSGEQCQGAEDAGRRHRQKPAGGHSAFHRAPGGQNSQRDDRLRAQAVVQWQPERQEQARGGPYRAPAVLDGGTESGITSLLISHQHASAISSVGNRIQMLAVDTCAHIASRS